jgi:hypothetical protein
MCKQNEEEAAMALKRNNLIPLLTQTNPLPSCKLLEQEVAHSPKWLLLPIPPTLEY